MDTPFLAGFAGLSLGASLVVAVGAQNTFVLQQGLRREHVGAVVATCLGLDAVLMTLGVNGVAAALGGHPAVLAALGWAGAGFLLWYAWQAARRAWTGQALATDTAGRVSASAVWFLGLGYGARLLAPVFARPVAWRWLDGGVAVTMGALGLRLALGVLRA